MMKDTGNKHYTFTKMLYINQCLSVGKLAREEIGPYVREMERDGKLKQSVIDTLFQNGVSYI